MKILIAEDSGATRSTLQQALADLGHSCLVAADGTAAWQMFGEAEAEVVISDRLLPGIDGEQLCRKVRGAAVERYAYFIMLTSPEDREHVLGALEAGVDDYLTRPFGLDELRARLIAAERVTSLHRRLKTQQVELERLNASPSSDARRDDLTGLGNRLRLQDELMRLAEANLRYGHRFSIALFDIDHFRRFNDAFGELAGDEALREVAGVLVRQARGGDTVYRHGGDELLVILVEQDLDGAETAAERMRAAVEAMAPPVIGAEPLTVSVGVAALEPEDGREPARVVARADEAVYEAKKLGRNRVLAGRSRAAAAVLPTGGPAVTEPRALGRLLVVEDDLVQARMIEGMLNADGRHRGVVHVETLEEAKRFLHESRVSCVLLDLALPDSGMLDGLIELRGVAPEAPIVVVTADADESLAVRAVQAGAQDYLIKDRMDAAQLCRSVLYAIERKRGELVLAHGALHDALTGLPNRTLFLDRLSLELAQSERRSSSVAVLFVDLDGFKAVNDSLGHEAGDRVLCSLAGRLLACMRPGDTVARYGGDEFTILGTEIACAEDALAIAHRVAGAVMQPFTVGAGEVQLNASIGVALGRGRGRKPEDVIREADEAMYHAKREGGAISLIDADRAKPPRADAAVSPDVRRLAG